MKFLMILGTMLILNSCASGSWHKMDANKDGQVTKAEFNTHKDMKFSKADKNGDGVIDASEMSKKKCSKKKSKKHCAEKSECKSGQCDMKKQSHKHKAKSCTNAQCQLHSKDK